MKKYLIIIGCLLFCLDTNAEQTFVSGYDYSSVSYFSDSVVRVEDGAILSEPGNTITMTFPVYLHNNGQINGTIDTGGYNLFVYNSGNINGNINATGANVMQIITSDAEVSNINLTGGNLYVTLDNYQTANFNDIKDIEYTEVDEED